jgi:N-acetyl-D-muramate 6-phosphate phosphatase
MNAANAASRARAQALLLDLDGTLLDTAPDMGAALNRLLEESGRTPISAEAIRPHVSHGAAALVRLGFAEPDAEQFERLRRRFLELYAQAVSVATRPFAGFPEVLAAVEAAQLPWGIVTNKPGYLTEALLTALDLRPRAACVVAGDTLALRKPHPEPLLHAARLIHRQPAQCLYVGDSERDIRAGRAAGMQTIIARFGYLGEKDRPDAWQADGIIDHPRELIAWLALEP